MAFSLKSIFGSAGSGDSEASRSIGIDFGSSAIKVVELELVDDKPTLKTYGELQLGPYGEKSVGETVDLPYEKRKEALVDVLREAQVQSRRGVFVTPLEGSFVVSITVQLRKGETLETKVPVEARKYIPVPMADVALDWADISSPELAKQNLNEVLLVAIQNQMLEEQRRLMDAVSMRTQPTEIECFGAIRALHKEEAEQQVIIDIGAETSKLYVSFEGLLHRIHRASAGGQIVTNRLATLYSIPFEDAELLKRTASAEQAADSRHTVGSVFERSMQEFRRVIEQYEARVGSQVAVVTLTGSTAKLPFLKEYVREMLQRDVEIARPFDLVQYPAFLEDTLTEVGPNFTVAVGAALRSFSQ